MTAPDTAAVAAAAGQQAAEPKPYYEDAKAGIRIFHGDARILLPQVSVACNHKFNLALFDPPYGVNIGIRSKAAYVSTDDSPKVIVPMVNDILQLCFAAATLTAITPGVRNMWLYPKPIHCGSFFYPAGAGVNEWGFTCWQPIFFYGKDPYAGKGSRPDSFESTESAPKNGHPCPKPYNQWLWLLNRTTVAGDTVIDPMCGSGTTLRCAKDMGLKCVGIDIEESYCEIAARYLQQEVLVL